jgi:peptidoglycan/LPS O-acetylase OafA/YrhL
MSAASPAVAPPPGNPRFALMDSLRGIAVLGIIVFHVTSITGAYDGGGVSGAYAVLGNQAPVLFFVLSGFLLYRPFVAAHADGRPMPSVARYVRRRVLRIVPAYWVALTVLAIVPGVVGVFSGDWWRYYFFLQGYSQRTVNGGIPTAWTLTVEVGFYVLLPLWALLLRRAGQLAGSQRWLATELWMLVPVAAGGLVVQVAASRLRVSSLLATTPLGECVWLTLGMALAVVSVDDQRRPQSRRSVSLAAGSPAVCWIAGIACLAGLTVVLHPGNVFQIVASLHQRQPYGRTLGAILLTAGVATFLIAPAAFGSDRGGIPRRVLAWRPLAALGLISYGVYLYHLTLAEVIAESSDPAHFSAAGLGLDAHVHHLITPLLFVSTLAASAVAATVSYRVVELPFLRLKERGSRWDGHLTGGTSART